jgi:C-terminal processing protease CtpA/Prc
MFERIFVKSIIPKSSASRAKSLRPGDMILSVDGFNMQDITHDEAIEFLKSICGSIEFVIISCPGTLV